MRLTLRSERRQIARRRFCRLTTTGGEALAKPVKRGQRSVGPVSRVLAGQVEGSAAGSIG